MTSKINIAMTPFEWALLIALSVIWGGSFFFIEVAVEEIPPLTVVAARVCGGAFLLYVALRLAGLRLPANASIWGAFLFMGLFNNLVAFTLIAWGQTAVTAGLASILNATTPFFTAIFAHMFTRDERLTPVRVAGLVIGFGGVAVMIGIDALAEAGRELPAQLAILAASTSYGLSAVFGRRFARLEIKPMTAATGQMITAGAMALPLALLIDQPWSLDAPSPGVWLSLLGLAFLATFVAYQIYYRILATAGSVNIMLVTLLVPVSAILLGAVFLGERLAANHVLGMVTIGLGLAAIDGRPLKLLRRKPT